MVSESYLRNTIDWCRKWLVDLNAGKIQLVSFDLSNNLLVLWCYGYKNGRYCS